MPLQVSTKRIENGIEITVSDNGPGIPDSIKDKIFQPFLRPSLRDKERAWVYRSAMIL